ncbi:MAG: enoyl-CoA hydratase/isomerase family protein [Candidatus Binataceae bacterium]
MPAVFTTLRFIKRGPIARVTLNRPSRLNAYNMAMRDELSQIFDAIHDDPDVRALIIGGAGRAFSTGGDLTEFGLAPSPIVARWVRFRRDVWGKLISLPIPTIAAIHSLTVGGGLEIALLCDFAIAADDTRICLPETGLGMIPGVGGTQTAARRARPGRALDLCITGRWIDGREAKLIGLVDNVVAKKALAGFAEEFAQSLISAPRECVALTKICVNDGLDLPLAEGIALERRLAMLAARPRHPAVAEPGNSNPATTELSRV